MLSSVFDISLWKDSERLNHQLDRSISRMHESIYFHVGLGILFTAAIWNEVPHKTIYIWLGLIVIHCVWIVFTIRLNRFRDRSYSRARKWATILVLKSFFAGIIWGYASWHFILADDPIRFVLIVYTITAIAGASINPLYLLPPSYLVFIVPYIIPFVIRIYEFGSWASVFLAVPILIVFVVTLVVSTISDALSKQKKIAEKADQEKSRFIAAASHDLRQPLHSLGLFINALENKSKTKGNEDLFDKVNQSLNNLGELFNSILDISKLDSNAIEFRKTHFQLNEIFTALQTEYQPRADAKSIEFDLIGHNEIVYSDKILVQRIIKNLVDNAFSYTKSGSISIIARRSNEHVILEVCDTGVGIPENEQENIFSEFYQLGNPERDREKGLGLGLSIVKRLCKLLDIELSLASETDKGTTFTLNLLAGNKSKISLRKENLTAPSWSLKGVNIMVIDDEKAIRESMSEVLAGWQLNVRVVEGLEPAIETLTNSEFVPDIIISDFRLRAENSGVDIVNKLKRQFEISPKCLLITGDTSVESLEQIKASGYLYLHKPVSPMLLRRALFELQNDT